MVTELKRPRGRPRKESIVSLKQDGMNMPKLLKVHIYPSFAPDDVGGIPRVVEGQRKHLPKFGIEIVETAEEADIIAYHATVPSTYINLYPHKIFISMVHGFYWSEYDWSPGTLQINSEVMEGIRVADVVITQTEWVANSVRRHTSRPVSVIPHGIDTEDWSPTLDKGYVLWNKFRPDPVCDPTPVNEVAKLLPNVQFISSFGEEDNNVALVGRVDFPTAKALVEGASIYLCTTRETFGVGTLEALACGIPIVGFDFGGQSEFIENGKQGILVTPGDIPALAKAIEWCGKNRATLAPECRKLAEQFSWMKACEEYATLFKKTYENKNKVGPRVSVIVTNYNLHEYLEACLDSIKEQSDQDWECIFVDDASTSPLGKEIAFRYALDDPRFRVIKNEKNVYLAEARNVGIRQARGKYILPLDADDMLAPNAIATLADALDADRTISVAYGGVLFVDEDGETPTDYRELYGKNLPLGHSSWPFPFTHEQQIQQMNLLPYASMYRREAWEYTGGYRRRCRTAEDADMWTRFSSYGFRPKMVTDADTLIYRNRSNSMSRTQGSSNWIRWFSWNKLPEITPAGAGTKTQLPVASLDPIIISVIIPVGPGHEKLVTDAIDSVDTQSFRNWECIVVNDTGKPLETELPSWVRVLETRGNTGPAHARNTGIKASRGRLFLPLDADDYLQPDALQFMYEAYLPNKDVVYSDFWQTDMEGKNLNIHECDDYDPKLLTAGKRNFKGQIREGMIHAVTALTPKSVWEKIGGYDESMPGWEDWDFQLAVGDIGQCSRRIAAPLFVYRKNTGLRREENYKFFEKSKEGILRKWGKLWEGGQQLAVCQSCSRGHTVTTTQQQTVSRNLGPESSDAVLIEYTGEKMGATGYRGASKTMYYFAAGDQKYVLAEDVGMFLKYSEFRVIPKEVTLDTPAEPVLVASGNPNSN